MSFFTNAIDILQTLVIALGGALIHPQKQRHHQQKQRLLIARALAGNPEILILDDSSSALDYRTDAMMRSAVRQEYPDTTLLLVAQRVSSVKNADQILVLEEGRMAGLGTHEALLRDCPLYAQIAKIQMGGNDDAAA